MPGQGRLVGAPSFDDTTADEGIAYVFRGRSTGIDTTPHWTLTHPDAANGGQFGRVVAMGDLDGDGLSDLLVAAPDSNDGAAQAGAAWVFAGGVAGTPPAGLPVSRPTTEAMGFFGLSACFLRDVNGDGFGDMALGAPGLDVPTNNEGVVALLLGGPSLSDAVGAVRLVLPPDARAGAFFGFAVGSADVDADGRGDLIVGAPFFGGHGAVYVLRGGGSGVGAPLGARIDHPGAQAGATFGWAVGQSH